MKPDRSKVPWRSLAIMLMGIAGGAALIAGAQDASQPSLIQAHVDEPGPAATEEDSKPTTPPDLRTPDTSRTSGTPDEVTGPLLTEAGPSRVTIPSIGVSSPLTGLGLDASGAMEVPVEPSLAGWYTKGPAPGALGPAVIAGHVTWDRHPAVFYRLSQLSRGDIVKVARKDGQIAIFSVQRVNQYSKERFPTRAVFGSIDHAGLRLITCGGLYDEATRRYLDNVVAFAELVEVRKHS